MSKPRMHRWVCPTCGGGALAPSRPRKDDVRRFCLTCSAKSGRLVERRCPSLEGKRAAKAEARKTAAERAREREQARLTQRHTAAGIDVRDEWKRLCSLPYVKPLLPTGRAPQVTVAWSKVKDTTTGHARYSGVRVHFGFYPGVTPAEVKALLAHELAHVIAPTHGHGEAFRRTFALVLWHGYGLPIDAWPHLPGTMYEQQVAAERALTAHEGATLPTGRMAHEARREELRAAAAPSGGER